MTPTRDTSSGRLTKAQRMLLQRAIHLGGTINVFANERRDCDVLESRGLFISNGKFISRQDSITPAGRRAIAEGDAPE